MKTYTTILILVLTGFFICPTHAQTKDPNNPIDKLIFETSDLACDWPVKILQGQDILTPTHMATFYYKGNNSMPDPSALSKTLAWSTLSEEQRQFCKTTKIWDLESTRGTALSNYQKISCYAVTEEDAKKMAKAYIELLHTQYQERYNKTVSQRDFYAQRISELEKTLANDEGHFKEICEQFDKAKKSPKYISLKDDEASEAAKATVLHMTTLMDEITIEVSEIRARLQAIDKLKLKRVTPTLEAMETELTIQLAGIEAKRQTVDITLTQAIEFRHLYLERQTLEPQIKANRSNLEGNRRALKDRETFLSNRHDDLGYPEVFQNKATIHPVTLTIRTPGSV